MLTILLCLVVGKRYKQTGFNLRESNSDDERQRNSIRGGTIEKQLRDFNFDSRKT